MGRPGRAESPWLACVPGRAAALGQRLYLQLGRCETPKQQKTDNNGEFGSDLNLLYLSVIVYFQRFMKMWHKRSVLWRI